MRKTQSHHRHSSI